MRSSLAPIKNNKSRSAAHNAALGPTDATGAPTAPRRAAAIAAAHGTAQQLIAQWDRSSRPQRIDLLSRFIARHGGSTAAETEEALGPAALLFFSRIVTWMRLTYQLGYELSVQLAALSLLLQGQRFLSAFAEAGGTEMVTDILRHARAGGGRDDDRRNALVLLIHLANSGRVYRELICDGDGVAHIVASALEEADPKTLEFYSALFLSLGQGNPRKASRVHAGLLALAREGRDEAALCAASVLRALQMAREHAAVNAYHNGGGGGSFGTAGPSPTTANRSHHGGEDSSLPHLIGGPSSSSSPPSQHVPVVGVDSASPESVGRLLDTLFHLLRADSVKLRFEGVELLGLASRSLALVVPIVDRCLLTLDSSVEAPAVYTDGATPPLTSPSLPPIAVPRGANASQREAALPPLASSSEGKDDPSEVRARAQLRRLQLSCGRTLCSILLQPAEESRVRLYRHFEAKGGHMSLIRYLSLCDSRNNTAIDEACRALRLLACVPAVSEGHYGVEAIVARSRTASYLAAVLGRDLLGRVLEGADMSREQVLVLYKALRRGGGPGERLGGRGASRGGQRREEATDSDEEF